MLTYTNEDDNAKRFKVQIYYLTKGIIKNYNIIINGKKNFYDHPIKLDKKQYGEVRKLTSGRDEYYTTGCLLD